MPPAFSTQFNQRRPHTYRVFSLTWPASTQIYSNKRKEFNSQGTGLGHQHGRRFIVLGHGWDTSMAAVTSCENTLYSRTSANGHLSTMATFFSSRRTKNQYIDSCLKPLYNGHLFTTATFFCSQGGHCREIQLYTIQPHTAATFLNKVPIYQDYCFLHPRLNSAIYTRKNKTRLT